MARGRLTNRNANAVLDEHKGQIQEMLSALKSTEGKSAEKIAEDQNLYRVMVDADDLARISGLNDFYRIVPSAKPEVRSGGSMNVKLENEREAQRKLAINSNITNTVEVNGETYVIEDYLRGNREVDETTPASVLQEKQRLYPEGINLEKIPQAKSKTESSLFALGMNAVEPRTITPNAITPAPVTDLSYESRQMSEGIETALNNQHLLVSRSPLHLLRDAGSHGDSEGRTLAGTRPLIQSVMIGDMIRGTNPVTGMPYGPAFMENGRLVRDQLQGGHVRESNLNPAIRHDPANIIGELSQENTAKASRGKEGGPEFTDDQALFNTVAEALEGGQNLDNFKLNMRAVAEADISLENKINTILSKVDQIEAMKASTRRTKKGQSDWSSLL